MGEMVTRIVLHATENLYSGDREEAWRTYQEDEIINEKRFEIQAHAIVIIAQQQTVARDLQVLASIFVLASELERIGDYGKEIAAIRLHLDNELLPSLPPSLSDMAQKSTDMLSRALFAFAAEDVDTATGIYQEDDNVDFLYIDVYNELMTSALHDARLIESVNCILWVAHNLERVADRVTNICERTRFVVTGEL